MRQSNRLPNQSQPKLNPPKPQAVEAVEPERSSVNVTYKITPTDIKPVFIYRDKSEFSSADKRFLFLLLVTFFGLGFLFLSMVGVPK